MGADAVTEELPWRCIKCKGLPVDGTLVESVSPDLRIGTCSAMTCTTRKLVKIKLKSKVKGAEYADAVGKTTFRRMSL